MWSRSSTVIGETEEGAGEGPLRHLLAQRDVHTCNMMQCAVKE